MYQIYTTVAVTLSSFNLKQLQLNALFRSSVECAIFKILKNRVLYHFELTTIQSLIF